MDLARVLAIIPDWLEFYERDGWILDIWYDMHSPLAVGSQVSVMRWRCEVEGLTTNGAQLEIWERVQIVERARRGVSRMKDAAAAQMEQVRSAMRSS